MVDIMGNFKIKDRFSQNVLWETDAANLRNANLQGVNLRGANLRGADLRTVNFRGTDLREADLSYADFHGLNLHVPLLRDANVDGAANLYCSADLRGADLRNADLRGADLRGVDMRHAYLGRANLRCALINDADLSRASFLAADLRAADLRGADLIGADLRNADLLETNLNGAILHSVPSIVDAGTPDGWRAYGWLRDGRLSIRVGLREERLTEARVYWAGRPDHREVLAAVEYIVTIAAMRGWAP